MPKLHGREKGMWAAGLHAREAGLGIGNIWKERAGLSRYILFASFVFGSPFGVAATVYRSLRQVPDPKAADHVRHLGARCNLGDYSL